MKLGKFLTFIMAVCIAGCAWNESHMVQAAQSDLSWNLLTVGEWFEDYIVDATNGLYVAKDNYDTLEMIEVDDEHLCAIYLPECNNVHLVYYDNNQNYIGGEIVSAPKGKLIELPKGCSYMTISMARAEIRNSFLVQDERNGVYVVAWEDGVRYSSVKSAVAAVEASGTVVVMPGTYKGNIKAWGKEVNILGTDKETCIIENNSSSYSAPPLEIAAGTVKNLTVRATGSNSEGDGAGSSKAGAYGVHIEDEALCDNLLKFENCYIYSDFNSAVGMGMRGGCSVQFVNVHLKGKEFGLFCHDSAYSKYSGVQNLSMINCVIEGMQGKTAVRFDSQGVKGTRVNLLFVNTLLKSQNIKTVSAKSSDTLLSTRNNGGKGTDDNWMGLKNYYLDEDSYGNNILEMDY